MTEPRARGSLLLALAVALASAPAAATDRAFLALASGEVSLLPAGETAWAAARVDAAVSPGDTLRTGLGGDAKLVLGAELLLHVSENTTVRLPASAEEAWDVEQLRGRVHFLALGGTRLDPRVRVALPDALFIHGWEVEFEILGMDEPQDGERPWRVCNHSGGLEIRGGFGVIEPKDDNCADFGPVAAPAPADPPEDPPETPPTSIPNPDLPDDAPAVGEGPGDPLAGDLVTAPDASDLPDPDDLEPEIDIDPDLPSRSPRP